MFNLKVLILGILVSIMLVGCPGPLDENGKPIPCKGSECEEFKDI
jgi:hypothetical protein